MNNTFDEIVAAERWSEGALRCIEKDFVLITEDRAIRIAIQSLIDSKIPIRLDCLQRPSYVKRPSYFPQPYSGKKSWGWLFGFLVPAPDGFDEKTLTVFVDAPSGEAMLGGFL